MDVLHRLVSTRTPGDLEARILCSCRARLFRASWTRRRNALRLAAVCTMANLALGVFAFQTHQRHRRLRATLDGG